MGWKYFEGGRGRGKQDINKYFARDIPPAEGIKKQGNIKIIICII
jgi:hypothetical protein